MATGIKGALTAKTMGMPRWALGAGLVGAIGIGLYLRSRSKGAAATAATTPTDTTGLLTTDPTGLATPPAGGASGVDTSGLATASQIDALQQTLSDLPSEIAISLGTTGIGDVTPWGPGVDNPGGGVPTIPSTGAPWNKGGSAIKTIRAHTTSKPTVNKAKGRTPPKHHPKPVPKIVKKKTKIINKLKPKPKAKPPAKKTAAGSVHGVNLATANRLAANKRMSQAVHRAASRGPAGIRLPRRR